MAKLLDVYDHVQRRRLHREQLLKQFNFAWQRLLSGCTSLLDLYLNHIQGRCCVRERCLQYTIIRYNLSSFPKLSESELLINIGT